MWGTGGTIQEASKLSSNTRIEILFPALFTIIIIIIIKNENIRMTLCENAAGALYIVNKMCVDGLRNVQG